MVREEEANDEQSEFTRKLREIADRMTNNVQGLEQLEEKTSEIENNFEIQKENRRKFIKRNSDKKNILLPLVTGAIIGGCLFDGGLLSGSVLLGDTIGSAINIGLGALQGGNGLAYGKEMKWLLMEKMDELLKK
uniref:Uncharacterized protein n=1 Tax=Meloidogyne enterolobii TaxID=390850 RepID=A0A6V7WKY8_MELEN|nr:unnamed protein product [Meloidogyne enterolobii]